LGGGRFDPLAHFWADNAPLIWSFCPLGADKLPMPCPFTAWLHKNQNTELMHGDLLRSPSFNANLPACNSWYMRVSLQYLKSPATVAAILLYGIVFLFAAAYFLNVPWRKLYTVLLYGGVAAWAAIVIVMRLRAARRFAINRIDLVFAAFTLAVAFSVAANWWEGTLAYVKMMPVFFLIPYLLGRVIRLEDGSLLQKTLIGMGIALLILIALEFVRAMQTDIPFERLPNPTLFGHGHGVMLSGLLLSAAFLSLISLTLLPANSSPKQPAPNEPKCYLMLLLIGIVVVTMGWIASRGPALASIFGLLMLLGLRPQVDSKRRLAMMGVITLALVLAVTQAMWRNESRRFYADIIQKPIPDAVTDNIVTSAPIGPYRSVLGDAVICGKFKESISERWIHYRQAFAIFLSRPVFGAGANHYGFYACAGPGSFPHSTLLQVLAELGIIGGALYIAMIWFAWSVFSRSSRGNEALQATVVGSWFASFLLVQFIIAQLIGNYFLSAPLYFAIGAAAGTLNSYDTDTGPEIR
jgi:hypothetical protein